jgi:hypothetical protein
MIVMATMPTNAKVMRRSNRSAVFRLANERQSPVICSIFVGTRFPKLAVFDTRAISQHSLQKWLRRTPRSMTGKSGSKMTGKQALAVPHEHTSTP